MDIECPTGSHAEPAIWLAYCSRKGEYHRQGKYCSAYHAFRTHHTGMNVRLFSPISKCGGSRPDFARKCRPKVNGFLVRTCSERIVAQMYGVIRTCIRAQAGGFLQVVCIVLTIGNFRFRSVAIWILVQFLYLVGPQAPMSSSSSSPSSSSSSTSLPQEVSTGQAPTWSTAAVSSRQPTRFSLRFGTRCPPMFASSGWRRLTVGHAFDHCLE